MLSAISLSVVAALCLFISFDMAGASGKFDRCMSVFMGFGGGIHFCMAFVAYLQ